MACHVKVRRSAEVTRADAGSSTSRLTRHSTTNEHRSCPPPRLDRRTALAGAASAGMAAADAAGQHCMEGLRRMEASLEAFLVDLAVENMDLALLLDPSALASARLRRAASCMP